MKNMKWPLERQVSQDTMSSGEKVEKVGVQKLTGICKDWVCDTDECRYEVGLYDNIYRSTSRVDAGSNHAHYACNHDGDHAQHTQPT